MRKVEIRYHRPPNRLDIFVQDLVVDEPDYKVTLHDPATLAAGLRVGERLIFEPGAAVVWFVFPGAWYDLGRFHLRDGTFTGYYANLITPPELGARTWTMYDLCLDLWIDPDGRFQVLDQDEFDEAVDRLWIDAATARRARTELEDLVRRLREGRWPPPIAREYDLERVRALRASAEA
jgi:predicted RNA-binding protein associated with RNAse of E/G family